MFYVFLSVKRRTFFFIPQFWSIDKILGLVKFFGLSYFSYQLVQLSLLTQRRMPFGKVESENNSSFILSLSLSLSLSHGISLHPPSSLGFQLPKVTLSLFSIISHSGLLLRLTFKLSGSSRSGFIYRSFQVVT